MLNIVVPMAGRGSRFVNEGYTLPKPLIPVHGKPMIQVVINNMTPKRKHRFIFLVLQEHVQQYQIDKKLKKWAPGSKVIVVDKVTEGPACTVLLAKDLINNDDELMIANSDQYVDIDINDYLATQDKPGIDGLIMVFWCDEDKWSYVQYNDKKDIIGAVEKQVVSNDATVGIYNYKKGRYFVEAAESLIKRNFRVNNEFYVAPAYNDMVRMGHKLAVFNIGKLNDGMYGMGVPKDLKDFLQLPVSKKATNF